MSNLKRAALERAADHLSEAIEELILAEQENRTSGPDIVAAIQNCGMYVLTVQRILKDLLKGNDEERSH